MIGAILGGFFIGIGLLMFIDSLFISRNDVGAVVPYVLYYGPFLLSCIGFGMLSLVSAQGVMGRSKPNINRWSLFTLFISLCLLILSIFTSLWMSLSVFPPHEVHSTWQSIELALLFLPPMLAAFSLKVLPQFA